MSQVTDQLVNEIYWTAKAAWLGVSLRGIGQIHEDLFQAGWLQHPPFTRHRCHCWTHTQTPRSWEVPHHEGRMFQGLARGLPVSSPTTLTPRSLASSSHCSWASQVQRC